MVVPGEYIKELLDKGHSTEARDEVIAYVGNDEQRMSALMDYFFHEEWRYNQRAAWPVGIIGVRKPYMILPYIEQLIHGLDEAKHVAILRNTFRIFQGIDIPEDFEGLLYDKCMVHFVDLKSPVAVRVFAMAVMANIAENYEELREEVLALINEYMPYGTAGYRSRAKKIINRFSKL